MTDAIDRYYLARILCVGGPVIIEEAHHSQRYPKDGIVAMV